MVKSGLVCVVALAGAAACSGGDASTRPSAPRTTTVESPPASIAAGSAEEPSVIFAALEGTPLTSVDLQLLANDALIDADDGTRHVLTGLPTSGDVRWAHRTAEGLVITIDCAACEPRPNVYFVRNGEYLAEHITDGYFITPSDDGLWAKAYLNESSCQLGKIDMAGALIQPAQDIDCSVQLVEDTPLGLVASSGKDWLLLDPESLSETDRWRAPARLIAVVAHQTLVANDHVFTLTDTENGTTRTVAAPDAHGDAGYGIVSPDGRYVAVEYRDPAQVMDLWVLDLTTMQWTHAPSMPVWATIKRDPPTWTDDGRLAVLGYFGQEPSLLRHLLVLWRPGQPTLALLDVTDDTWFIK